MYINCTLRGPVKTPLTETLGQEALTKLFAPRTALGRIADPEDITPAFMFLLSDASAFITGTV
jgi:NAD(P)-dependent dehydrogenase (short-subunit alcohol dehydrogenase family)